MTGRATDREIWFAIFSTRGVGSATTKKIARKLDDAGISPRELHGLTSDQLVSSLSVSHSIAQAISENVYGNMTIPSSVEDGLLVLGDEFYPNTRFMNAQPPLPIVLWAQGDLHILDSGFRALAVAGSRDASEEVVEITREVGRLAVKRKWLVVSGLAAGVDSAAHQAAVDCGGSTIGVMASGIRVPDHVWKHQEHDSVCVVSQFSPREVWSGPRAMQRNSTIAGLSDRVFIAAAGDSGGSWEMGKLCLKEHKQLFVLERPQEESPGNSLLIREGAIPITADSLENIFEDVPEARETLF